MKKIVIKLPGIRLTAETILMLVLGVFFITKMIRTFSGSSAEGGIWNYIQILLAWIGIFIILLNIRKLSRNTMVGFLLIFTAAMLLNSLFYLVPSKEKLFNYFMLLYPISILVISIRYTVAVKETDKNILIRITYYVIAAIYILSILKGGKYSTSTGAVADVYYVLGLFPLILVYTKKHIMVPCCVCGAAILLSGKRTGMFVFVLMLLAYFIVSSMQTKDAKKHMKFLLSLVVIMALFVGLFVLLNKQFNTTLLHRLELLWKDNDSSGRYERWEKIGHALKQSSLLTIVFGHGDGAVYAKFGGNAHNDFLEVLYNYGVVPLICYIGFYVCCAIDAVQMLRQKYQYAAQFIMSIICAVGLSMFSFYVIAPTYITCGMLCVGYLMIDFRKKSVPSSVLLKLK